MAKYRHGIYVNEVPTKMPVPTYGTSGIQVVIGTAPVNLAEDPTSVTNKPILIESMDDMVDKLGYQGPEKDANGVSKFTYTLAESAYASFALSKCAPVVMINVLDPARHTKDLTSETVNVANRMATLKHTGVLLDTVKVTTSADKTLVRDTDYTLTFTDEGLVAIGLMSSGAAASEKSLKVTAKQLDPSKVTAEDIIGGIDGDGVATGIACVRDVYARCHVIPATLLAPGFDDQAAVGAALIAETKDIDGVFRAFALLSLNTGNDSGKWTVASLKTDKDNNAYASADAAVLWPYYVKAGSDNICMHFTAVFGAGMQAQDAANGDCPSNAPSNINMGITGAGFVTSEGFTELNLNLDQAADVNGLGVTTACWKQGWKTAGVETSLYPNVTDVKDRFINVRRMMSWQANVFIVRYMDRLDSNISHRAIEALVNDENIRCNALTAQGKWAGGRIEFRDSENPITDILAGKVRFYQYVAPFTPAKEIYDTLEYSADILKANIAGGDK